MGIVGEGCVQELEALSWDLERGGLGWQRQEGISAPGGLVGADTARQVHGCLKQCVLMEKVEAGQWRVEP